MNINAHLLAIKVIIREKMPVPCREYFTMPRMEIQIHKSIGQALRESIRPYQQYMFNVGLAQCGVNILSDISYAKTSS